MDDSDKTRRFINGPKVLMDAVGSFITLAQLP